jgi:flavin reductase (DIM6/NTAB) family NADH-FMN oxidoreductase RutF
MVSVDLFERMHRTADPIDPMDSEFDHGGLGTEPAETVDVPRVADAKAHFECTLYDDATIGDPVFVMGHIEHINVDDSLCTDGKVDIKKMDPFCRLSGDYYATRTS